MSKSVLTDRDAGFFDNLVEIDLFRRACEKKTNEGLVSKDSILLPPKRRIYKLIHDKKNVRDSVSSLSEASPYHAMLHAIHEIAGIRVLGLLLEVRLPYNTVELELIFVVNLIIYGLYFC